MRVLLVSAPAIAQELDDIIDRLRSGGAKVDLVTVADLEGPLGYSAEVIAGPGTLPITATLLSRCPALRGLVSIGSGCEGFDRDAAEQRGIRIATGATRENVAGMASATIMLMLALCHDLPGAQRALLEGSRRRISRVRALDGLTVGLVGYGAIGREVGRRLLAWELTVRFFSPSAPAGSEVDGAVAVGFDELLRTSDLVSLHAALNSASRHLLDRAALARMKEGAYLVNTARGGLVEEAALVEALQTGELAGAALDCFETEPLPPTSALRTLPNVILTPHSIGHTAAGARSVVEAFVSNIMSLNDTS